MHFRPILLRFLLAFTAFALVSCSGGDETKQMEALRTREVKLPNGKVIRAEPMVKQLDMMRGMMFRDSLADDRGMLFFHASPGKYPYWMYHVRIPLDIIWMDANRRIVEISPNTPPCPSELSSECPNFGGHSEAQFVLELSAGNAGRNNLKVGDRIEF